MLGSEGGIFTLRYIHIINVHRGVCNSKYVRKTFNSVNVTRGSVYCGNRVLIPSQVSPYSSSTSIWRALCWVRCP
jgi:hypothetical protein